jgi:hypothetical protein
MANRLTTLGYFRKRLKDSGYSSIELFKNYSNVDPRAWSVMIDPGGASLICTCYINHEDRGDMYLELYDGGQYIPGRLKLQTSSFEVFVEKLVKLNIVTNAEHSPKGS